MKKVIQLLSIVLVAMLSLASCQEDNQCLETPEIKIEKTELNLTSLGTNGTIKVLAGIGEMTVTSSDEKVAIAIIDDKVITVTAKGIGEAIITVRTAEKKTSFKVVVTAPELSVEQGKEELTLTNKGQMEVSIVGGTEPIKVKSSDDTKVTAKLKDGKVLLRAKSNEGTAIVTLTDANGNTATIKVTLAPAPELTFDKMEKNWKGEMQPIVNFILGDSEANRTIKITGGTVPFLIIQEDTNNYSDPKSSISNITLDKKEEVDSYGTKYQCKAGSFTTNKIIFDAKETLSGDTYIVRDATGKEAKIDVSVQKTLEVSKTSYEVLVGETVNSTDKIKVEGLAKRITIKSNSNEAVIEASIEQSENKSYRALILKGLSAGKSTLTITDGVVEKTVEVTVVAPEPITLYKEDGTALVDGTAYEFGKFIIKGGTGAYEVTFDSELIKKPVEAKEIAYGANKGSFEFTLERNINIAQGGEVIVTVTNKNNPTDKKSFKVSCPTLLDMTILVNGKAIPKNGTGSEPYYAIQDGMYAGYAVYNVKVNDVIEFTVKNGSGAYTVVKDSGWGSDKVELTENGDNKTFKLTAKKAGTYYGNVTITDKANAKNFIKITRIEIK